MDVGLDTPVDAGAQFIPPTCESFSQQHTEERRSPSRSQRLPPLRQCFRDQLSAYVGETKVPAEVSIGEPCVLESEQV